MHTIYTATVFAGSLVCLLVSLLLFFRREEGNNRSRLILSVIVLFSVFNYSSRFLSLLNGDIPEQVVSAKLLLQANFMILGYIMYPIEVIAPGWLNFRRILRLYSYWIVLVILYVVTKWAGVQYTPFGSIVEMIPYIGRFEVLFRLVLSLFIFLPGIIVFLMHRTRLYQNSDLVWVKKYVFTLTLNVVAYLLVVLFNNPVYNIVYYYISVGCSLYIVYMELFDRIIVKSVINESVEVVNAYSAETPVVSVTEEIVKTKDLELIQRLENYIYTSKAWRNPDLTLNTLASELMTNRTSLGNALRSCGYEQYTSYVNRLRTEDFIRQIETGKTKNFQDAFFNAGFRSRSTALRNFRQFTGTTPSDYFSTKGILIEEEQE
jgi:AraC-like DNA-binding protein